MWKNHQSDISLSLRILPFLFPKYVDQQLESGSNHPPVMALAKHQNDVNDWCGLTSLPLPQS